MGKKRPQLSTVHFRCSECPHRWEGEPEHVEDYPEQDFHPWAYHSACPICGAAGEHDPQELKLLKMWANASGPRTASGKAASAKNLEGHPTPDEARRTRFNAMRHGLDAQTATYFPAKPGAYPHCDGCEYRYNRCPQEVACLKRTELYMRHHIAFETQDPAMLREDRGRLHATLRAIVDDCLLAIIQDGVRTKMPQWYYDKDGGFHLAKFVDQHGEERQLYEVREHPLIRRVGDMVAKLGLTLTDSAMTERVMEDQDQVAGHLSEQAARQDDLLEYQERQATALENLSGMIQRAREQSARDPILVEYDQEGEHGGE